MHIGRLGKIEADKAVSFFANLLNTLAGLRTDDNLLLQMRGDGEKLGTGGVGNWIALSVMSIIFGILKILFQKSAS